MKKILPLFVLSVLWIASCSKKDPDPITIDSQTVDLKFDKVHQFVLKQGSQSAKTSSYSWKSSDEKVGTVDTSGIFKARKIGEATVTVSTPDGKSVVESKITVSPYSTICTEPVLDWGALAAQIKSKEKRVIFTEDTAFIAYTGENAKLRFSAYFLEKKKLVSSILIFSTTNEVIDEAVTFFEERYPNASQIDNGLIFINDAKTFQVALGIDNSLGFYAEYSAYSSGGRLNAFDAAALSSIKQKLKSLNIRQQPHVTNIKLRL